MRYEFQPGASGVLVRMHAFLHKATASTDAVRGWFDVTSHDLLGGPVSGTAQVEVGAFTFTNALLAVAARVWLDERPDAIVRFDLTGATGTMTAAAITGQLTIGDTGREICAEAVVTRAGDDVVVTGTWPLSQRAFGLKAPPGVKDLVDIEFRLVARSTVAP